MFLAVVRGSAKASVDAMPTYFVIIMGSVDNWRVYPCDIVEEFAVTLKPFVSFH